MIAVIDTNVVVASFLVRPSDSPVYRIVRGMLESRFSFLLSVELLSEYRNILTRPAIRRKHGLTDEQVDLFLEEIAFLGIVRELVPSHSAPDPGDDHLWQLLNAQPGSVLVTGDHELQNNPPDFASVLSPVSFCAQNGI